MPHEDQDNYWTEKGEAKKMSTHTHERTHTHFNQTYVIQTNANTHTHMQARVRACTHTHTHTHMRTHTHTQPNVRHTNKCNTHTHTHTHTSQPTVSLLTLHIRFTGALSRVLVAHLSQHGTGLVAATRLAVIRAYSWTGVIIPSPTLTAVRGGRVGLAGAAAVLLVTAVGAVVVTGTVLAAVGVRGRQAVGPLFAGVAAHALHVGFAPALSAVLVTGIREDNSLVHS